MQGKGFEHDHTSKKQLVYHVEITPKSRFSCCLGPFYDFSLIHLIIMSSERPILPIWQ